MDDSESAIEPIDSMIWHAFPKSDHVVGVGVPSVPADIINLLGDPDSTEDYFADNRMELASASMLDIWIRLFDIRLQRQVRKEQAATK
ncbi:MAG: hypothetical protein KF869_15595 [Phycisphaeraceae bacterium]|nr:hypothetical protein [Phycisphaeraceae bacterium]